MSWPTAPYEPRTIENRPDVTYDPDDRRHLYAEDIQNINAEISGIEEFLDQEFSILYEPSAYSLNLSSASSQYLYITDAAQTGLELSRSFTFEAWIKLSSAPGAGQSFGIVSKYNTSGDQRSYLFSVLDFSGNIPRCILSDDGINNSSGILPPDSISLDTWYHVAVSFFGGTAQLIIYINGYAVFSNIGPTRKLFDCNADFVIGAIMSGSYFNGKMYDVRVWNTVRTDVDIRRYMGQRVSPNSFGLVANYIFDNDFTDETSNNNDLTAVNSPTFSSDIPY